MNPMLLLGSRNNIVGHMNTKYKEGQFVKTAKSHKSNKPNFNVDSKVEPPAAFQLIIMEWHSTPLACMYFYQCNMFRPNSRSSSGTTNCIKYKWKT
jgi:hypothetical protein